MVGRVTNRRLGVGFGIVREGFSRLQLEARKASPRGRAIHRDVVNAASPSGTGATSHKEQRVPSGTCRKRAFAAMQVPGLPEAQEHSDHLRSAWERVLDCSAPPEAPRHATWRRGASQARPHAERGSHQYCGLVRRAVVQSYAQIQLGRGLRSICCRTARNSLAQCRWVMRRCPGPSGQIRIGGAVRKHNAM